MGFSGGDFVRFGLGIKKMLAAAKKDIGNKSLMIYFKVKF
jgi:hypothetical protein